MKVSVSHHRYAVGCIDMDNAAAADGFNIKVRKLVDSNHGVRSEIDVIQGAMKVVDHIISVERSEHKRI